RSTYRHAEKGSNREKYFTGWEPLPPWISNFIDQLVEGNSSSNQAPRLRSNVVSFDQLRANEQ
ncbi:MAG: hypothetical protein L0J69_03855, partial [Yaniella sp.]|nr:hypothetical protein [Yaniella sp.]